MKLREDEDKYSLLVEANRLDLLNTTVDDLPEDVYMGTIRKRKGMLTRFKNFRKSQNSKKQWRTKRWGLMKGIGKFHKSTGGKRFHRSLGRFLAVRHLESAPEKIELVREDALKAVSSLKTHIYIEQEYYMPVNEYVEFQIFCDYAIPLLSEIEHNIYQDTVCEISKDQLELLIRMIDQKDLVLALREATGYDVEKITEMWGSISEGLTTTDSYYFCNKFGGIISALRELM